MLHVLYSFTYAAMALSLMKAGLIICTCALAIITKIKSTKLEVVAKFSCSSNQAYSGANRNYTYLKVIVAMEHGHTMHLPRVCLLTVVLIY